MATLSLKQKTAGLLLASLLIPLVESVSVSQSASAIGPVTPPVAPRPAGIATPRASTAAKAKSPARSTKTTHYAGGVRVKRNAGKGKAARKPAPKPPAPQTLVDNLATRTIAPGVVHKVHRSSMYINVLDVDLKNPNVQIRPIMAGESFNRLEEVKDQAQRVSAIAAVNGNYFKRDGTPLGTLIMDGEWISGPIFNRTSFGITDDGRVLVDPVNLHGVLETSNADVPSVWVNNINQPRRTGAHVIAYTRRWGSSVQLAYDGTLLAVDASGRIIDKQPRMVGIPYGGFVLSDSKDSKIAQLNVGDLLSLSWQPAPSEWKRVVHAVSGGPVLIRNGNLYVGLKDENFRKSWTGSHIHARTAIGVTADKHLLLATIEGPHTLWDVAKFLKKLGAVDALNLDGGGSTTMVVNGATVTRNRSTFERRVASSLAIMPRAAGQPIARGVSPNYIPASNLTDFAAAPMVKTAPAPGYEMSTEAPIITQQEVPSEDSTMAVAPKSGLQPHEVEDSKPSLVKKYFGWMKHLNPLK
jgi:uncharacterized protein YigE (DUF2233 family)